MSSVASQKRTIEKSEFDKLLENFFECCSNYKYLKIVEYQLRNTDIFDKSLNDQKYHLIHFAVICREKSLIELILKLDPIAVHRKDWKNNSLLHFTKNLQITKRLVEAGCDVNWRNDEGFTPLTKAVFYSQFEIAIYLLSKGADPTVQYPVDKKPIIELFDSEEQKSEFEKYVRLYSNNREAVDSEDNNSNTHVNPAPSGIPPHRNLPSDPQPYNSPVSTPSTPQISTSQTENVSLNPDPLQKAQESIKCAGSAINYDYIPTAVGNLQKALRHLTTGQDS